MRRTWVPTTAAVWLILLSGVMTSRAAAQSLAPTKADRTAILDAVRAPAAMRTRQAVRIVVSRLNRVGEWAVLEGELVSVKGRSLDWSRASECEPELDKRLWSIVRRSPRGWDVVQLAVCASEPPYWDPTFLARTSVPCDVLAGLTSSEGKDLVAECRRVRRTHNELETR